MLSKSVECRDGSRGDLQPSMTLLCSNLCKVGPGTASNTETAGTRSLQDLQPAAALVWLPYQVFEELKKWMAHFRLTCNQQTGYR